MKFKDQIQLIRESIFKGASKKEEKERHDKSIEMHANEWIDKELKSGKLKKNADGSYDYTGNVSFNNWELTKIPIQFNKISGNFSCAVNYLTSLKGCPKQVGGNFICGFNSKIFTDKEVKALCKVKGKIYT